MTKSNADMVVVGTLRLVVHICLVNQWDAVAGVGNDELRMGLEVVDGAAGFRLFHTIIQRATEGFHHPDLRVNRANGRKPRGAKNEGSKGQKSGDKFRPPAINPNGLNWLRKFHSCDLEFFSTCFNLCVHFHILQNIN